MKKLRIVFVLVTAAVLLPVLLLVDRALDSARAELALERRTVAERVIDEMERELSAFLRREEDRPFAHYRFLARADDPAATAAWVRSPLAEPLEPFVLGAFQVAPDGGFSTPLWPEDEKWAAALVGWQPDPEAERRRDLVRESVRGFFLQRPPLPTLADAKEKPQQEKQRAGTTVALSEPKLERVDSGPLQLLEKLNRGADARQERSSKLSKTQVANTRIDPGGVADSPAVQMEARIDQVALVDLRLEPMVGRDLGGGRMMLYRTVVAGESAFRQGLLLSQDELVRHLAVKALGSTNRGVEVTPESSGSPADLALFRHRFAEPFAPAVALVKIDAGQGGALESARLLAALLVVAVLSGLFAVYRMAAYAVSYAQRRSDFVSAVTHELKTPLTAIRMYSEMLRDGMVPDEEKRRRYYDTILAEGERLSRLVDNVLELARLERREKPPPLLATSLEEVLGEARGLLLPHAEKEGFTLELSVEPGLPLVQIDRDGLLQVIFNLVDNAFKYSRGAAEKSIAIRARRQGERVIVGVEDRGPGVTPHQQRHLFEPFWRGENELTRKTKGTGIGLALVRGLVERMGGEVVAVNRQGGGLEVQAHLALAYDSKLR